MKCPKCNQGELIAQVQVIQYWEFELPEDETHGIDFDNCTDEGYADEDEIERIECPVCNAIFSHFDGELTLKEGTES